MKRVLMMCIAFAIIVSCNSDDATTPPNLNSTTNSNFYALTVGNSWVYKNFRYNLNTQEYEDVAITDSLSIVGTENIFGNTYYKFRRMTTGNEEGIAFCSPNGETFEYYREFEGKLIRSDGIVQFVNNDYEQILRSQDTWGSIYERLIEGQNDLSVEAGTFSCIHSERYAISTEGAIFPGKNRYYYADGFGLISDTSSFVSSENHYIERRLVSYNIQ